MSGGGMGCGKPCGEAGRDARDGFEDEMQAALLTFKEWNVNVPDGKIERIFGFIDLAGGPCRIKSVRNAP